MASIYEYRPTLEVTWSAYGHLMNAYDSLSFAASLSVTHGPHLKKNKKTKQSQISTFSDSFIGLGL